MEKEKNPREAEAKNSALPIPLDILFEIFLKLPAKSVARFANVSKSLATTIIRNQDFIRSFSFRSSKQKQRLLLAFSAIDKEKGCENWYFFSSSLNESSSPSSTVFLSRIACDVPDLRFNQPDYVHGLISFVYGEEQIISNPSTGKNITLPSVKSKTSILKRFFGYDPFNDQYKALCVTEPMCGSDMRVASDHQCQLFTLESSHQKSSWRNIECSIPHRPQSEGLCINGVLYYYALMGTKVMVPCLVRFDVRSETFDFLTTLPVEIHHCLNNLRLINYEGNVASAIRKTSFYSFDLWVLEDFKKQEWFKVSLSTSKPELIIWNSPVDVRGIANTGEIIYASLDVDDYFFTLDDRDHELGDLKLFVKVDVNSECEFQRFSGAVSFLDYVESVMFS